jgi:eukaryotic-like serine/threonine-protein kinase
MGLSTGTRLGPYEIQCPLGAGGMGEVYRARDTRLERTVAIKVLPPEFSSDPERRKRFEQEARSISSLNHPHICVLYDIGHTDKTDYLVLEFLDGETLDHRLERGALPLEQVLRYGIEIADALDKAHRQGLIHRDLKPGNIMLTKSGAKLLDFGLAKALSVGAGLQLSSIPTSAPTRSKTLTVEGMVLGTLQYMSPEQFDGKPADQRSDIFALGAVLYEMATGNRAFEGQTPASVMAAIMEREAPSIAAHRPGTPPAFDWAVKACLAKDPDDRWQNARDLGLELKWILEHAQAAATTSASDRKKLRVAVLTASAAAVLVTLALTLGVISYLHRFSHSTVTQFVIIPPKAGVGDLTLSPNGRSVAFISAAMTDKSSALWIRTFESLDAKEVPGTEGASSPFWSPDSRFVGFFADNKLKKVEIATSTVQIVCEAPIKRFSYGGTWSPAGVILFVPDEFGGILTVSANGGVPMRLTTPVAAQQEVSHLWPYFLPDGQHFLYFVQSKIRNQQGIYVAALDFERSRQRQRLIDSDSEAVFAPPGHLLVVRSRRLFAQSFDPDRLSVSGDPVPIADNVEFVSFAHFGDFSVSANRVLAYKRDSTPMAQLAWRDRTGAITGSIGPPGEYMDLQLSPDGKQLALERMDPDTNSAHIWVLDLSLGTLLQLTPNSTSWEYAPRWSPDGKRILYDSNREYAIGGSPGEFFAKSASGDSEETLMLQSKSWIFTCDWSRNFILYSASHEQAIENSDLWLLPNNSSTPALYLQRAMMGRVSPDGKWIAYISSESGSDEIYVRPVQHSQGKWKISDGGGSQILWRSDGKELFYLTPSKKLTAVPVTAGATFTPGKPAVLFELHDVVPDTGFRYLYAVSRDGKHFLTANRQSESAPMPITVVLNWTEALPH